MTVCQSRSASGAHRARWLVEYKSLRERRIASPNTQEQRQLMTRDRQCRWWSSAAVYPWKLSSVSQIAAIVCRSCCNLWTGCESAFEENVQCKSARCTLVKPRFNVFRSATAGSCPLCWLPSPLVAALRWRGPAPAVPSRADVRSGDPDQRRTPPAVSTTPAIPSGCGPLRHEDGGVVRGRRQVGGCITRRRWASREEVMAATDLGG